MVVRLNSSRWRKRGRHGNGMPWSILWSRFPPHKTRTPFFIFFDAQSGRFRNVRHQHVRVAFSDPPDLQPAADALGEECAAGFEFRVPCDFDQNCALVVDAIVLAPLAADGRRFDAYAMSFLL